MRRSRLCEKLDDAGVKYRQDSRGDMPLPGHELVKALQYGWIRGLTSASTTAMALLGDLVTHMTGAFESLLNMKPTLRSTLRTCVYYFKRGSVPPRCTLGSAILHKFFLGNGSN